MAAPPTPPGNTIVFRAAEYIGDLDRFKREFSSAYSLSLRDPNTRTVIDGNLTREQQAVADSLVARRNKEARLGTQSFLGDVKSHFRGKDCSCLKRHFIGCERQVIGFAELMAGKDPERFIWVTMKTWAGVAKKKHTNETYSTRQISRCLVLLEVMGVMIPRQKASWRQNAIRMDCYQPCGSNRDPREEVRLSKPAYRVQNFSAHSRSTLGYVF